jgi:hypothetical protein
LQVLNQTADPNSIHGDSHGAYFSVRHSQGFAYGLKRLQHWHEDLTGAAIAVSHRFQQKSVHPLRCSKASLDYKSAALTN